MLVSEVLIPPFDLFLLIFWRTSMTSFNFARIGRSGQFLFRSQISTGGYVFEILTGWLSAFDTILMVRSREIATKESEIRIKILWVRHQGEIGRQSSFAKELLISSSSKRHSFDCSVRTSRDREKPKIVLKPSESGLQIEYSHDAQW